MKTLKICFFALMLTGTFNSCTKKEDPAPTDVAPVASFTMSNNGCQGPCTVSFTNTSQNATSYSWNFGDGGTSTLESPSHAYAAAGTYSAKLTASSSSGSNTATSTVTIGASSTYYLSYKVNGTLVTASVLSAVRGSSSSPRTLTLTGTAAAGGNPKLIVNISEPGFGWSNGMNVSFNDATSPNIIAYTNSSATSNTYYSSVGMTMFVNPISYTNGGDIVATFTGEVKDGTGGATTQITEGKLKMKFSN
jgi:PKD repeat protein